MSSFWKCCAISPIPLISQVIPLSYAISFATQFLSDLGSVIQHVTLAVVFALSGRTSPPLSCAIHHVGSAIWGSYHLQVLPVSHLLDKGRGQGDKCSSQVIMGATHTAVGVSSCERFATLLAFV